VSLPFIDCPEVVGKTVESLRLYPESVDGVEAIIEFADDTSLSWCTVHKSPRHKLIRMHHKLRIRTRTQFANIHPLPVAIVVHAIRRNPIQK